MTEITPPSPATLKKYGLTEEEWLEILHRQGDVCALCKRVPNPNKNTGKIRLVTDHEHVKGWSKMVPEKRKVYVRGLVCWVCNHYYLGRGITSDIALNAHYYLMDHEKRKNEKLAE